MKKTILRILLGAILFSLVSAMGVSIIGLVRGWQSSAQFSDGLFWAGVVMIALGFISLMGYRQRSTGLLPVPMDPADRTKLWAADAFRGQALMAVFGISGLLLFGLSFLTLRLL